MLAFQKLVRNGNSTQVTIPRALLNYLQWLPGQLVTLEVRDDRSFVVRLPRQSDYAPIRKPAALLIESPEVKP